MSRVRVHPHVAAALSSGDAVVALESALISHGLPRPDNRGIARQIEQAVRDHGAVPATVGIVAGSAVIGLDRTELEEIASRPDVVKVSVRDLATVVARGGYGATTVAATAHLAAGTGIRVFATGGLGGVHRQARDSWDESADLMTLSATGITVVCAGVKSILDVPATLERLESLNVGVLGYRTDWFPGFYLADSGCPLEWRVDSPAEVAEVMRARADVGTDRHALVVANPLPIEEQLDPALHERIVQAGMATAAAEGVAGKQITPYLLQLLHRRTEGSSLELNVRLVLRNAALAAEIAVAYAHRAATPS